MGESKEYFLKRILVNEAKIKELQAQNAKYETYVASDKFPKKNGKKPLNKVEKMPTEQTKEEKGYFGI